MPPRIGATVGLLTFYVLVLAGTAAAGAVIVGASYRAEDRVLIAHETAPNGEIIFLEQRYHRQQKIAENQLNSVGLYDGRGITWWLKGAKRSEGMWRNGYRQSDWRFYDRKGALVSINTHEDGRPVRYQLPTDGSLMTVPPDNWPFSFKLTSQSKPLGTQAKNFPPKVQAARGEPDEGR